MSIGRGLRRRQTSPRLRGVAVALVPTLVAVACAGAETTGTGGGTTYEVGVDGSTDEFHGSFHRFFPRSLTVQPGDTVVFRRPENGEPHTVTLGNGVPTSDPIPGGHFFEGGFGGPPRRSASMPCFLSSGLPPIEGCSPAEQEPMAFDGTQSWFNSGGLLGEDEFTLELADDIAPGTYTFVCLVHAFTMKGTIEVVGPEQPADDPEDVVARGSEELDRQVALMLPLVERPPSGVEGRVEAARFEGGGFAAWANSFFPEEIEIPVGGTVTWIISHIHTISFNASESARPFYEEAEDGSVRENELGAEPSGDPSGWDGSGFLNSGLRAGLSPPDEFSVTFTDPGTYAYRCLVHFDMEGRVNVGG